MPAQSIDAFLELALAGPAPPHYRGAKCCSLGGGAAAGVSPAAKKHLQKALTALGGVKGEEARAAREKLAALMAQ